MKKIFKKDKFSKARGGRSRLLEVLCSGCGNHVCFYQKDGPGILKRMYIDRIVDLKYKTYPQKIDCTSCGRNLGVFMIYEKEDRPAFRLFVGAVSKKIVK